MARALAALLVLAVALAAAWLLLTPGPAAGGAPGEQEPRARRGEDPGAARSPAGPAIADLTAPAPPDGVDAPGEGEVRSGIPDLAPERMTRFRGAVLLRRSEEEPDVQANAGRFDVEVVRKGERAVVEVEVANGRFELSVPRDGLVRLGAGELDGSPVHFERPPGLFAPSDIEYALVGVVSERITLDVVDGATGAPLDRVSVRRAGASAAPLRLEGAPDDGRGERVVTSARSPVELPRIDAPAPIWLHVSAEQHATTAVLVDPRVSARHEVQLWRSADLDLALAGPRREEVRMLVLTRAPRGGAETHAGTVDVTGPAVERLPSTNVARLRGLAAVRTRIEAKGFDARGRVVDLGDVEVELGPGETRSAELAVR